MSRKGQYRGCKGYEIREALLREGYLPAYAHPVVIGMVILVLLPPARSRAEHPIDVNFVEQGMATVRDCMAHSPVSWVDAWQQEYLDTIREALATGASRPDYPAKIELFQRGFARYWAEFPRSTLTRAEFDVGKAEVRWYCETFMAERLASGSEKALLKAQLRELCDYAGEYLRGRFPFLVVDCVEEAKKGALAEFDEQVDSPLLPIFRRPLSDEQLRAVKAGWAHLRRRWHFIWREVRYGGGSPGDSSDPGDHLSSHPHYRLAKRCLAYLAGTFWSTSAKPPAYVVDAIRRLNAEKAKRARIGRQGADAERELAMRCSNQIEQLEEWSFVFTALLETASAGSGQDARAIDSLEGGDAYDLKKQP
jgi:hypothetical protein